MFAHQRVRGDYGRLAKEIVRSVRRYVRTVKKSRKKVVEARIRTTRAADECAVHFGINGVIK